MLSKEMQIKKGVDLYFSKYLNRFFSFKKRRIEQKLIKEIPYLVEKINTLRSQVSILKNQVSVLEDDQFTGLSSNMTLTSHTFHYLSSTGVENVKEVFYLTCIHNYQVFSDRLLLIEGNRYEAKLLNKHYFNQSNLEMIEIKGEDNMFIRFTLDREKIDENPYFRLYDRKLLYGRKLEDENK